MAKIMDTTIPYNHPIEVNPFQIQNPTEVNSIHFEKFNTYWD